MNVAEWIIVGILSFTLFVFLILGIILLIKLIKLTKEAKLVIERGQDVVDRANDVVDNVKQMTSLRNIAKGFGKIYNKARKAKNSRKGTYDD